MDWVWVLVDVFFPCAQPRPKAEIALEEKHRANQELEADRLVHGLTGNKDELTTHLASVRELLQGERDRRQGVDTRLTTIIGLSSIAGTIIIGTMISPRPSHGYVGSFIVLGLFYVALQLGSAILAAVGGLGRRAYPVRLPEDILPSGGAYNVHLRRQIRMAITMLADHRSLNNEKVTMMAVAHRAMQNFLAGLLLLAVLGIVQAFTMKPNDDLVQRLREDHELRELLRGPVGNPGPRGDAGPPGAPGEVSCTTNLTNKAAPVSK